MAFSILKQSFSGGELSPSLSARVDLSKYHLGARKLENFYVHPHGGISNRTGLRFVGAAKEGSERVRIIPFVFSQAESYVVEFGVGYIRFFRNKSPIVVGDNVPYEVASPYAEEDLPLLRTVQSSDTLFIFCADKPPMKLIRYHQTAWVLAEYDFTLGPFLSERSMENRLKVVTDQEVSVEYGSHEWTAPGTYTFTVPEGVNTISASLRGGQSASVINLPPIGGRREVPGGETLLKSGDTINVQASPDGLKLTVRQSGVTESESDTSSTLVTMSGLQVTPGQELTVVVGGGGVISSGFYGANGYAKVWWNQQLTEQKFGVMTALQDFFTPDHVGSLFKIRQQVPSKQSEFPDPDGVKVLNRWNVETSGYWAGTIRIERQNAISGDWELVKSLTSGKDKNYSDTGSVENPTMMRLASDDFVAALPQGTSGDSYMFGKALLETLPTTYEGVVKVTEYVSPTEVKVKIQKDIAIEDTWTDEWFEGAWSPKNGYPGCITFYQDRVFSGGTLTEPHMFFGSNPGDYHNYSTSLPLVESDALSARVLARQNGRVRSITAIGDLLVLTEAGEFRLSASREGVLSPTNIDVQQQGNRGISGADPVMVGNQVIFVQSGGSTVRDFGYSFEADGFSGNDLTIMARHLFEGYQVVEMAYQQEPDSIIWVVRSDGMLLGLTYMKEHEVWAWHHHVTDGRVESVAVIPKSDGRDEVWFVVNRQNGRFIEVMEERPTRREIADAFFVDSGLTYAGDPVTKITGLDHLKNQEVAILAEGAVVPRQVVREITHEDGSIGWGIELEQPAGFVHIGLPYESELETMSIELPGAETLQGKKKKIVKVVLRLENSVGAWVGVDGKELQEVKWRDMSQELSENNALFTGDKRVRPDSGYNNDGRMRVVQKEPLPLTILALVPEVELGG